MSRIADMDCAWINKANNDDNIAVSSRIRLARNMEGVSFPHSMTHDEAVNVLEEARTALSSCKNKYLVQQVSDISPLSRQVLVEKHLISPDHAEDKFGIGGVAISDAGEVSIMINEEDHLRIQCLLPGLSLDECWEKTAKIDDELEAQLDYAFHEEFGYLTACPTNVGTGLRASAMLHLPALVYAKSIASALSAISQVGLVVRGIYGEGTDALGNMFQISNQITLGLSETEIIENLHNVTQKLIEQEQKARDYLLKKQRIEIEDAVGRAYGILTGARKITSEEAMRMLSNVRLGVALGLLRGLSSSLLNELMVLIQPASLQRMSKEKLTPIRRDVVRATVLRQRLKADI